MRWVPSARACGSVILCTNEILQFLTGGAGTQVDLYNVRKTVMMVVVVVVVVVVFVHKVLITIDNIRNVFLKRNVNQMKQRHRNTQGQHTCTTGYLTDSKLIVTYLVF